MAPTKGLPATKLRLITLEKSSSWTICVGEEKKEFIVHEDFIDQSEFFRRALNGNWLESKTRVINMVEQDPEIFAVYLHHVYTNDFSALADGADGTDAHLIEVLSELYVLAEKLQDKPTKNEIIEKLYAVSERINENGECEVPSLTAVKTLYNGTMDGNAGRRLVVDIYKPSHPSVLGRCKEELPKDFVLDLAMALLEERSPIRQTNAQKFGIEDFMEG